MSHKLRKLSRRIYEQTKHLPWTTITIQTNRQSGSIRSPETSIKDRACYLLIGEKWPCRVRVAVIVEGVNTNYPGGRYYRWWRWCWEKVVFRRVATSPCEVDVVPCDSVLDAMIGTPPGIEAGDDAGRLSLPSPDEEAAT